MTDKTRLPGKAQIEAVTYTQKLQLVSQYELTEVSMTARVNGEDPMRVLIGVRKMVLAGLQLEAAARKAARVSEKRRTGLDEGRF